MPLVLAEHLVKSYPAPDGGEKLAVNGLTFEVHAGQIYGLLGPNGAGKTTALRMMGGMLTPTHGRAVIHGHDTATAPLEAKRSIGFLTANTALYGRLTVRDVLVYFARLHDLPLDRARERAAVLIDAFGMSAFADQRCGSLSTGQKQRANIARALVADPAVLIMDEPTLGLDVLSNRTILEFIVKQRDAGKAVILSTHYLDEAELLCDRVGLLHQGRLMAEGTMDELRARSGQQRLSQIFLSMVEETPVAK